MEWQIPQGDDVLVRAQPWVEHELVGVVAIDAVVMVKTILRQRTGPWTGARESAAGYPLVRLHPRQPV